MLKNSRSSRQKVQILISNPKKVHFFRWEFRSMNGFAFLPGAEYYWQTRREPLPYRHTFGIRRSGKCVCRQPSNTGPRVSHMTCLVCTRILDTCVCVCVPLMSCTLCWCCTLCVQYSTGRPEERKLYSSRVVHCAGVVHCACSTVLADQRGEEAPVGPGTTGLTQDEPHPEYKLVLPLKRRQHIASRKRTEAAAPGESNFEWTKLFSNLFNLE